MSRGRGGDEQQTAFVHLKEWLVTAPILCYPDFSRDFIIHTDASGYGIGAVLSQMGCPPQSNGKGEQQCNEEVEVVIAYTFDNGKGSIHDHSRCRHLSSLRVHTGDALRSKQTIGLSSGWWVRYNLRAALPVGHLKYKNTISWSGIAPVRAIKMQIALAESHCLRFRY